MLYRWRTNLQMARFYRLTRAILETPPLPVNDAPWSIVSIVTGNYLQMYLLAMKSFYRKIKRGKILAIIDRNTSNFHRRILQHHFPGISFVILEDIDTGVCQRGGTWERLVYILDRTENEYVIQLDCDTLTFGEDIDDVILNATNNTPFTLSGGGLTVKSLQVIAADARATRSDYVGVVAESLLERYPDAINLKYVRGSSGFAGFAKGGFSRLRIEEFHRNMEKMMPQRWREWGTEQCGSNFAIANSPDALVLPYPKYANFWRGFTPGQSAFLHFIGTYRYLDDYFAKRSLEVIKSLQDPGEG